MARETQQHTTEPEAGMEFRAVLMGEKVRETLVELATMDKAPARFRACARLMVDRYDRQSFPVAWDEPEPVAA
jgi:hypothetical protein